MFLLFYKKISPHFTDACLEASLIVQCWNCCPSHKKSIIQEGTGFKRIHLEWLLEKFWEILNKEGKVVVSSIVHSLLFGLRRFSYLSHFSIDKKRWCVVRTLVLKVFSISYRSLIKWAPSCKNTLFVTAA